MQVQKIFKAGNSEVVAIPKELLRLNKMKNGDKIVIEGAPFGDAIIIRKQTKSKGVEKSSVSKEFRKWLAETLEEDKEILDELELR